MYELTRASMDDSGVIGNYILDEARKYGVSTPAIQLGKKIDYAIEHFEAWKIEIDGMIVAFVVYDLDVREPYELTHVYIHPKYRTNKSVLLVMYRHIYGVFKGKRVKLTKLHPKMKFPKIVDEKGYVKLEEFSKFVEGE